MYIQGRIGTFSARYENNSFFELLNFDDMLAMSILSVVYWIAIKCGCLVSVLEFWCEECWSSTERAKARLVQGTLKHLITFSEAPNALERCDNCDRSF